MSEASDDHIAEIRRQIAELFERDEDFARRSNLLLDEILVSREQTDIQRIWEYLLRQNPNGSG